MYFVFVNKRKGLFFVIFSTVLLFGWVRAQTQQTIGSQETTGTVSCGDMSFVVEGNFFVKPDQKATYGITSKSVLDQEANIEYELRQDKKLIKTSTEQHVEYFFTEPWIYILKTILRRSEQCVASLEQSITVAKEIWLGIGLGEQEISHITQTLGTQGIWFVVIPGPSDTLNDDVTIKRIQHIAQILPSSDVLLVEEQQARLLFDHIDDMRIYGIWLPSRIILVGKIGTSALRRLLHQSPAITDFSEIAISPTPYLSSVVQQVIDGNSLENLDVVRLVHPQDMANHRGLPLSKATDYLLLHWMSINFLLFLLCIPLFSLFLVFLKQVLWLHVGDTYYLLLTTAATVFLWRQVSVLMFLAAFLWHLLAQLITKKIYLLYAPKVWLTITLTCLIFMMTSVFLWWWGFALTLPTDPLYAFFPLITFSLMMHYIYPHYNSLISKNRRWWFIQFVWWVVCLTFLFQRNRLQQLVLWYPDIVLLALGVIVYLGRFAWLQISEYLRFWPLVTKYFDDEE